MILLLDSTSGEDIQLDYSPKHIYKDYFKTLGKPSHFSKQDEQLLRIMRSINKNRRKWPYGGKLSSPSIPSSTPSEDEGYWPNLDGTNGSPDSSSTPSTYAPGVSSDGVGAGLAQTPADTQSTIAPVLPHSSPPVITLIWHEFMNQIVVEAAGDCLFESLVLTLDHKDHISRTKDDLKVAGTKLRGDVVENTLTLLNSDDPLDLKLFFLNDKSLKKRDIKAHREEISSILTEWKKSSIWTVARKRPSVVPNHCDVCNQTFSRDTSFQRHRANGHSKKALDEHEENVSRSSYKYMEDKIVLFAAIFLRRHIFVIDPRLGDMKIISLQEYKFDYGETEKWVFRPAMNDPLGLLLSNDHYSGTALKPEYKNLWDYMLMTIPSKANYLGGGELAKLFAQYVKYVEFHKLNGGKLGKL